MKSLIIIRGVQGSGKSTLAELYVKQGYYNFEADMYFIDKETGKYEFNGNKIHLAHKWCQEMVEHCMKAGDNVVVSNTFVRKSEMKPYLELAKHLNYTVQTIICQGEFNNSHGVNEEIVAKKREQFEYH